METNVIFSGFCLGPGSIGTGSGSAMVTFDLSKPPPSPVLLYKWEPLLTGCIINKREIFFASAKFINKFIIVL